MAPSRLRLRGTLGVPEVRDVEPQHHRVVLVDRVVAVHRVLPVEVTEAEEQGGLAVRLQSEHVLAADLDEGGYGGRPAIDRECLELLEVGVDGMFPATSVVDQCPLLDGILLDREADVVAVEELFVNLPAAATVLELER